MNATQKMAQRMSLAEFVGYVTGLCDQNARLAIKLGREEPGFKATISSMYWRLRKAA